MKSRFPYLPCLLLALALSLPACQPAATLPTATPAPSYTPTPSPRPSPTPIPVSIKLNDIRQTIRHVGSGNFIHRYSQLETATEPVSKLNLEVLQPRFARVDISLDRWEPTNDNPDPMRMDAGAFIDDGDIRGTFELMKLLKERGVELTASIWEVPDWLVEDPAVSSARLIPRPMYPEAIESIAAWLLRARQEYGAEVDYVSFNEANLGVDILLTPQDVVALVKLAGPRFAELGLKTKWLLGDCSNIKSCLEYIRPIWAEKSIRPYLGFLAFHSWDGLDVSDQRFEEIAAFAAQEGLEVRCTEAGWDPSLWQRPEQFPRWGTALRLAAVYSRALKLSRATAMYYWEMFAEDYPLSDGKTPYPSLNLLRQMNDSLPPGSQILGTSPDGANRFILAAKAPTGIVIFLINTSLKDTVLLSGLPDGNYDFLVYDDTTEHPTAQTISIRDGSLTFELPGFSMILLAEKP